MEHHKFCAVKTRSKDCTGGAGLNSQFKLYGVRTNFMWAREKFRMDPDERRVRWPMLSEKSWVCSVGGKGLAVGTIESKVRTARPGILNVFNQSPPSGV